MSNEVEIVESNEQEKKPYECPAESPFKSAPSSSSIENTFRMAQVLQAKKDYDRAIDRYLNVIWTLEKIITINPGANIEVHWIVFSLSYISDIYQEKQDYNKSLAFREAQSDFLHFLEKRNKYQNSSDGSDDDSTDFYAFATTGQQYQELFKKIHKAAELEDKPVEDPKELAKRIAEARQKDEEARIEEAIRMLNEATEEREKAIKNSFWRRNLNKIVDHPVIFVMVVLAVALSVILYFRFKPKKKVTIPGGIEAQVAYLEKYMKEYEKKHGIKRDLEKERREREERIAKMRQPQHQAVDL